MLSYYVMWCMIGAALEFALLWVNTSLYPVVLPCFTCLIETVWLFFSEYVIVHTNPVAAMVVYTGIFGCVSGINFTSFLTASTMQDYITTVSVSFVCEVLLKLYPAWRMHTGRFLSESEILYLKVIIYIEYIPVLAYMLILFSDVSPWSGLVETDIHGCSGTPIVTEFRQRYYGVLFMVLGEVLSDLLVYFIIQKIWGLGKLVQPIRMRNVLESLFFFSNALICCLTCMEQTAMIFKNSIRGGIV